MNGVSKQEAYIDYLNALLSGDLRKCSFIIKNNLQAGLTIISLYEDVVKKALYQIGILWEYNKITVMAEHIATSITEAILNELYLRMDIDKKIQKRAIVACVEGELHQVGIKMVSDVIEMNGWDAFFLGANTSLRRLILEGHTIKADMFALSLSIYFNLPTLERMITEIKKEFPQIPIIVGGQAFRFGGTELIKKFDNTHFLPDLQSVYTFIQELNERSKNG